MRLQGLSEFGRIAAEFEQQLAEFFVRTDAYSRIEDQEHVIVVGRKGTGKTAIYQALLDRASEYSNTFATGLRFRDYPWGAHNHIKDTDAAPVEQYTHSWVFIILVELAKLVLTDERHTFPDTIDAAKAREALEKFIEKNWGEVEFRFRDIFTRSRYSLDLRPQVAGSGIGGIKKENVPRARLGGFLVEANRWLQGCLARILDGESWYFILFDELDTGFDPKDDEYTSRLIGLLLAARDVFQWSRDNNLSVAPVVFLRSDIYDGLSFPDKNKITRELVEMLSWTDELEGENSLKNLIDERIRYLTGSRSKDPWRDVFDDDVMRGTQHKAKHIAVRTYLRPRDMIQFCNLCLGEAKTAGAERIRNEDIVSARRDYSDYLVSELDDEIHATLPEWRRLLDVLRRTHKMRFSRKDFENAFATLRLERKGFDVDEALETLYAFGIIGFAKIGGGGYGGSAVAFSFRDPSVNFDPAAPYYRVHPGLKEALELVDVGETG